MEEQGLKVIIIGAGTGGLCLAHGLKRAGINVRVYERDRTRKDGLQGYRVGISPDGSRALHQCLPPELYDIFVATCARTPEYFNIMTEQFKEVLSLWDPTNDDPVNSEKSVSRMTLRQVLLTGLEGAVHFDKTFTHYEQRSDSTVKAYFQDGSSVEGDLLVAADGANSRVRKQYLPHAQLEETGLIAIGGKLPLTEETKQLLTLKVFNGITMILAPKGYSCIIHVMEFKWDKDGVKEGIGGNDAALIAQWPGLLFDNTRDYIMWGFSASKRDYPKDPKEMSPEEQQRTIQSMTKKWHPNFQRMIKQTDPSTIFSINIRTSVPVEPWEASNVTLIGDAIHTMTPGKGVGANTALRDAALLTRKLTEVQNGAKTLLNAVAEFEEQMRQYGFEAVLESRKQMDDRGLIFKPIIGRMALSLMRTGMRIVNITPFLKKRMLAEQQDFRGKNRIDD